MKLKLLFYSVAVGLLTASCVDDKYDLSDIDTTSRIEVHDLVIPVNFSEVYLSDIISLEETSDIKIIEIDGVRYYAVTRTGDFESDPITILAPEAEAPLLESQYAVLASNNGVFSVKNIGSEFSFRCDNVDKAIIEITSAYISGLDFTVQFNTPQLKTGTYKNLHLQLPKGMTGSATNGTYNAQDGVWTIPTLNIDSNGTATAVYTANYIDFTVNDFTFANSVFDFTSFFSIIDAELEAAADYLEFSVDFTLSELEVTAFSGKMKYLVKGIDIAPIYLGALPKFLQGEETNLSLANPLICLQTTNPVADDKLNFSTALSLQANREDSSPKVFNSSEFTVGYTTQNGVINTVLSPSNPTYVPEKFTGYQWVEFANLGELLSGNGLPTSINVSAVNPQIPEQEVTNFRLGRTFDGIVGSYELFAPLALENGSTIVYTEIKDGWNKDVEDMVINSLTLTSTASNNTPLDATMTIYPLNVSGNRIAGVELTSSRLEGGAKDVPLTFTLKGEIKDLDGIEIVATVVSGDNKTLSPDQTLVLNDIRVKVNGYYQKKL